MNDSKSSALHVHWLTSLSLLFSILFIFFFVIQVPLVLFRLLPHAAGSCDARWHLAGLKRLGVAERAAVVIKEPAEGEFVEGVLWVLPMRGEEYVQSSGAVPAVTPCPGAALLLHRVKVGRVHWVGDLGPVGGRLLP